MDMMEKVVMSLCGIALVVVVCALKVVNLVWVRPKRLEKYLRNQGFKGNKYRFVVGDMKESSIMSGESKSKPLSLDDEDEDADGVLLRILPFVHHSLQKHGKSFITWTGWKPRVTIINPEFIKDAFTKSKIFHKVRLHPLSRLFVTGLLFYDGDQALKHRKIITPAFRVEKLKKMVPAFHLSCSVMLNKWEKLISSNGSCELDVWPHLQALSSDVISRTAFGSSYQEGVRIFELIKAQSKVVEELLQSVYIPGFRFFPTKRNLRMKAIDKEIKLLTKNIIEKRLKAMKTGEGNYDDLLGIMLASNNKEIEKHQNKSHGMTINEVIEECRLFYFAGQETTASFLVWTMILLSKHQEWQSRAREEVLSVLGDKNMDFDGLNQLKVVSMIFYEVLRLYPPVVSLVRQVHKDVTLGGFSLPSGVHVGFPIMLIHHDEEAWGADAKKFKPERFVEGISKATKNQAIYFPFSGGSRNCLGQNFALLEAKIAIAMILKRFSFEFSPSYVHAPHTVVTLQPQYGAPLILHKL